MGPTQDSAPARQYERTGGQGFFGGPPSPSVRIKWSPFAPTTGSLAAGAAVQDGKSTPYLLPSGALPPGTNSIYFDFATFIQHPHS